MRHLIPLAAICLSTSLHAQVSAGQGKPLGSWNVEYHRTINRMHAEPTEFSERARMTLRSVGDSLFGELRIGDSTSANLSALRGVARKDGYTLFVEDTPAKGVALFFSALGAAMDWLRESVHGIQPLVIRFDVTAKGDSLIGSRSVTGGMGRPGSSSVYGVRAKP